MNKIPGIFLLGLLSIAMFGCTSVRTYLVQVNGYTKRTGPLLAPGASVFVIENQKAQNPLVEKEIKSKIDNLLMKHGYLLAPYDKAQFYLFFTYGLGAPRTVSVTGPLGPGRCYSELGYNAYLPPAYGPYCTDTLLNSLDLDQPVVINCSGLGARQLAQDPEVFPISGHMAVVKEKRPVRCLMDEQGKNALAYVFPRPDVCKLGGTTVDHDWSEEPDPQIIKSIMARCQDMEPGLADAQFIESYVGHRPGRRVIRFEKEITGSGRFIFHNYGHGGSGYTVSWGCAQELLQILTGPGGF